jgi:hypothetical protein
MKEPTMRHQVGMVLGALLTGSMLAGCVDPGYGHRYGGGPYYDDRNYGSDDDHRDRHHHDRGNDKLPTLVCASQDGRVSRCRADFKIKRADVDKRYSNSPCEYGRSWGYDSGEVWVDRGCRARFVLTPAGRSR